MARGYLKYVFLALSLCACFRLALAETIEIPLPSDAKETLRREHSAGITRMTILRYESSLSRQALTAFFKRQMQEAGWRFIEPLSFAKGRFTVSVVFLHARPKDKKTRFGLSYIETPPKEEILKQQVKANPEKLDFMPLYKSSIQISLLRINKAVLAAYHSFDHIKEVLFFYKSAMPGYGWHLERETPIVYKSAEENCPGCKKRIEENLKKNNIDMKGISNNELLNLIQEDTYKAGLEFKRGAKESCEIGLIESVPLKSVDDFSDRDSVSPFMPDIPSADYRSGTKITVRYSEDD